MAITSEAGYIAARAASRYLRFQKASIANAVAGTIHSMWRSAGPFPLQPAIPGAAVTCDNTTVGALDLPAVSGSNTRYIDAYNIWGSSTGQCRFVDRLIHSGNLNGTLTTAQTVNTPALPARAVAAAVDWCLECYTDLGATTTTATVAVTYTDTTTQNLSVTIPATWRAGRQLPITAATGKVIASVQSVTLLASTLAAGAFGLTAQQDIGFNTMITSTNGSDKESSMILPIPAAACLSMVIDTATTITGDFRGGYRIIEG
jgi:hypothetical protein